MRISDWSSDVCSSDIFSLFAIQNGGLAMQLSEHFSLAEFTASDTARARHIANEPNARQIESMKALCANVLEPLRSHFGKPVRITSGFRPPELCLAVGSSTAIGRAQV